MTSFISDSAAVSFFGRPYAELLRCFGLAEAELRGQTALECPSGPSSFVAEANRRGIRAVGVDPLFYRNPDALRTLALSDFESMFRKMRAAPERFVLRTYASLDEAASARRAGLEVFFEDYRRHFASGRYRCGALPALDLPDRSFDVALCGHLLFIYQGHFDAAFHERALEELCRVAAKEVRIHPVVGSRGKPYEGLPALMDQAAALGFEARVEAVDHEFFKGANQTLVLRRRAT